MEGLQVFCYQPGKAIMSKDPKCLRFILVLSHSFKTVIDVIMAQKLLSHSFKTVIDVIMAQKLLFKQCSFLSVLFYSVGYLFDVPGRSFSELGSI